MNPHEQQQQPTKQQNNPSPLQFSSSQFFKSVKMVKVWFPSMYMRLVSLKMKQSPPVAVLQIPPSMTKTEVKEYLTKIYDIPVLKITAMNYLGE